jgi:hypothetical protein
VGRGSVILAAAAALLASSGTAVAQVELSQQCELTVPATLDVGGTTLVRSSAAVRTTLLGLVDLYAIAVYVPLRSTDAGSLASNELPKAVWVGICYDDTLPAYVPRSWRCELVPELGHLERRSLRTRFISLERGDIVTIAYDPRSGTRVEINDRRAIVTRGQALMIGFLDHWLGQVPVSDDLKRALTPGFVAARARHSG